MQVAAGSSAWYDVSADGGASFSTPRLAHNPSRGYPQAVAIWADMGVECGGVLPPSPGFAGGQCTAAYQLAADAAAGTYDYAVHGGDTAYNMQVRKSNQQCRPDWLSFTTDLSLASATPSSLLFPGRVRR
jgi:hypothetical protein